MNPPPRLQSGAWFRIHRNEVWEASTRAESNQKPTFSELGQVSAYLKLRIVVLYASVMAESLKQGEVQNDEAIKLANGYQGLFH